MWRLAPLALCAWTRLADADTASCIDGKPYDAKILRDRVGFLASKELDGRAPGTDGDKATRAFLVDQFRCLGLQPAFGTSYEQAFTADGQTTANVVGVIPGSDPTLAGDIIMIAAHHDHLGGKHRGANDNASGTVALLAVAQALQQRETKPKRTIVFAAFGSEETGMNGSYFYEKNAPAALPVDRMVQVINLDMVGSHDDFGYVAALGTFSGLAARKLLARLDNKYPKVSVGYGGKARGSDFEPFCKKGVPYAFFWTPDRCYHKTCDLPDRLDYARMADIASLAGDLALAMGDTTLDLAAARSKRGCGI
ncbi:MAG: M20/M25/M40 family metallo-hydrolase [Kofleriaceae bacterium]|nr:M20/M25/M40 family metallo-hydrolase [Kofleriaceae bacterium]